jgi:hypothetical protein
MRFTSAVRDTMALALAVFFLSAPQLHAQSRIVVPAVSGDKTTIVESPTDITVTTQPKKGTVQTLPSPADAKEKTYSLEYTANETSAAVDDGLAFKVAGEADAVSHEVAIRVSPAASVLPDQVYGVALKSIFALFALAVVLESALAVVFNWRPFVETFNPRAVRPLVAFVVAMIFVGLFNLDIVTSLVNGVIGTHYLGSPTGKILTALVISGGSAAVNHMLVALGYRELKTPETAPKPPPTKAWIAVSANRRNAKTGDIAVYVGKESGPGAVTLPPRVGTIAGSSAKNLLAYFLIDRGRYPSYGGHELDPAAGPYRVVLLPAGEPAPAPLTPGPRVSELFNVAPGAIIDMTLDV